MEYMANRSVGSGTSPAVITRSSQKMLINMSYPAAKGLNAIAVSKEPVVSPDRFRSTRQERSRRCVHLISFAMASDASAERTSERRFGEAQAQDLVSVRVSQVSLLACIYRL